MRACSTARRWPWPHRGHILALVTVSSCVLLSAVFAARRLFRALTGSAVDMINLCWKLAMVLRGRARPELLDTYESDRLPAIRQLVRMTERATNVFNSTNPLVHAALTRLAPIVLGRSAVQDKAAPRRDRSPPPIATAQLPRAAARSVDYVPVTGCRISSSPLPPGRALGSTTCSTCPLSPCSPAVPGGSPMRIARGNQVRFGPVAWSAGRRVAGSW